MLEEQEQQKGIDFTFSAAAPSVVNHVHFYSGMLTNQKALDFSPF